ncbi:hypothetical protein [Arenimonas oryziterrae]|uniref:PsbP C-terminal domain-containing protein n=1 Tax=Arenimonas oryziterrae DSM 21050 = YC6267 TaxID=1121015 RepID=A0A091AXX7_9GAMM|nr:hypothetical protein [Arenimonas oryziterrae]KFN44301.1 hypothetical protein N789_06130 [Arenimonas oryziterrae DSM 21050 = YC6267]
MTRLFRCAALLVFIALLASCASPGRKLVAANSGITVLDLQLDTSLDWSRTKITRAEVWTIDGIPLNRFLVIANIRPNEHVFLAARERKGRPDGPWYRPGMRADEIRDVLLDAMREDGFNNISSSNLRPAKFGTVDGLRFDAVMTSSNGLIYKATFGAAEYKGKLTHFSWIAPSEHYYERDVAAVNRMFDSIRFVK